MKIYLMVIAVMVGITIAGFVPNSNLDDRWERFKVRFNKKYTGIEEEMKRREIWEKNIAHIDRHNQEYKEGKHSYTIAENKFADMTKDEWKKHLGGKKPQKPSKIPTNDSEELDGRPT